MSEKTTTEMKFTEQRLKDLLVGALYELRETAGHFPDMCDSIGITEDELSSLGFSDATGPVLKDVNDYTYHCNCCGSDFDAADCPHGPVSEEDIECPECGCTFDGGYIEHYRK